MLVYIIRMAAAWLGYRYGGRWLSSKEIGAKVLIVAAWSCIRLIIVKIVKVVKISKRKHTNTNHCIIFKEEPLEEKMFGTSVCEHFLCFFLYLVSWRGLWGRRGGSVP